MAYPLQFCSSPRRNEKLVACWFAAICTERQFKRHYNSRAIKKLNVAEICDDITEMVSKDTSPKFNLHVSSQLMYGVTKIHQYQTDYYQKEMIEMEKKLTLDALSKRTNDNEFDAVGNLECPEIDLPLDQWVHKSQPRPDLHLLPNVDEASIPQGAASLNFGCLNDEELKFMLTHEENNLSRDIRRVCQAEEELDISKKMANIKITDEADTTKQLSQRVLSPELDIADTFKEKVVLTPQKRQSNEIHVDTPTKRRRSLFPETVHPAPLEDIPKQNVPTFTEDTLVLPPLDPDNFTIKSQPKKKTIIDKKIVLDDKQMMKWHQNKNIHCKHLDKPLTGDLLLTPARNLLARPSHLPQRWNANLRNLFTNHTIGPFKSTDEFVPDEIVQLPPVRQEATASVTFPTELSEFGKTDTAIPVLDNTVNILPPISISHEITNISAPIPKAVPHVLKEDIRTKEVNINQSNESFEDIDILLEKRRPPLKKESTVFTSSTSSSQPSLSNPDILAMLEVLWHNKEIVKFNDLIPEDMYTKEDAATVFRKLLVLHEEKQIILQQVDFSQDLYILKYNK